MSKNDIRIDMEFVNHPKTKRLIRVLGPQGFYSLVCLFSNVAKMYPKGKLKKCDEYDIADMSNWEEEPSKFIEALMDEKIGFLEKDGDEFVIHDWKENQPWIYHQDNRSEVAREKANKRWNSTSNADSIQTAMQPAYKQQCKQHTLSNAPTPTPTPTPTPIPTPIPKKEETETLTQAKMLATLLLTESRKHDEKLRKGKDRETIASWAVDIEKLLRIDQRAYETIWNVIRWCKEEGNFWIPNILSGKKLREKFPTLFAQMVSRNGKKNFGETRERYPLDIDKYDKL